MSGHLWFISGEIFTIVRLIEDISLHFILCSPVLLKVGFFPAASFLITYLISNEDALSIILADHKNP